MTDTEELRERIAEINYRHDHASWAEWKEAGEGVKRLYRNWAGQILQASKEAGLMFVNPHIVWADHRHTIEEIEI